LSQQDEASFKASMSKVGGVEWKRTNRGRFYQGINYRSQVIEADGENPAILF